MNVVLRLACPRDAQQLLDLYAPYILNTPITFEYEVPTAEAFLKRIEEVLRWYPWLVAEQDGKILGYAYASRYRARAAYQWDAEGSIYLCPEAQGTGVAAALYRCLMEILTLQGVRNFYGCITHPNPASEAFHRKLGFVDIGIFPRAGFKHGRWLDVLWNYVELGEKDASPVPPLPFTELDGRVVEQVIARAQAALNT